MVIGQPVDHVVKCVESRRCYHADLSHTSTEHLAPTTCAVDEIRVAHDDGPYWACQTFGQAESRRVGSGNETGRRFTERDRCVKQPRTVDMHLQPTVASGIRHLGHLRRVDRLATRRVVRILDAQKLGVRLMVIIWLYRRNDILG